MKRFVTALGICALLSAGSYALMPTLMAAFTWDGALSSAWNDGRNWGQDGTTPYPGSAAAGDIAVIDVATSNPVTLTGTVSNSVSTITIDANANSATVELDVQTSGSLTTTGLVYVMGEQISTSGADSATIQHSGGTFSPDTMKFEGSQHATAGHAVADIDFTTTVAGGAGIDTTVLYYVDFDVAGASVDFNVKDLKIGDAATEPAIWANLDKVGAGDVVADSIAIYGGASVNTIVTVSAGRIITQ